MLRVTTYMLLMVNNSSDITIGENEKDSMQSFMKEKRRLISWCNKLISCPNCGTELPNKAHKEWKYQSYQVKMLICPNRKKSLKAYYQNGRLNHTIPKAKVTS